VKKFKDHLTENNPLTIEDNLVLEFLTDEDIELLEETSIDPNVAQSLPAVLVMQRKSFRVFPNGQKVAMYYIPRLDKYVTIPYGEGSWSMVPKYEETIIDKLKYIFENKQSKNINFENGDVLKVDIRTAKNILEVYDSLNPENKNKVKELIEQDKIGFKRMADFAWKHIKNN
jgi:hypothetical protein